MFTGSLGGVLRRGNFRRDSGWPAAVAKLGVPGLHFHDLRHTGRFVCGDRKACLLQEARQALVTPGACGPLARFAWDGLGAIRRGRRGRSGLQNCRRSAHVKTNDGNRAAPAKRQRSR